MRKKIKRLMTPVQRFIKTESASGIVLGIATILALAIANSPLHHGYEELLHFPIDIRLGDFEIREGLLHWVNDLLMAIFFLLVGLEIKRELKFGELSNVRSAMLPIVAAAGGALLPAGIYLLFTSGSDYVRGWAIPMATDIAFALGVLALLGPRIPGWAKTFLMALAVVDDLIAVVIIALFYSGELNINALIWALVFLGMLLALNFAAVRTVTLYLVVGLFLWAAVYKSGIHATIAGVIVGFCVPAFKRGAAKEQEPLNREALDMLTPSLSDPIDDPEELLQAKLEVLEDRVIEAESPLHRLEHSLHPIVAWGIIPLFAFVNAGVVISTGGLGEVLTSRLTLGIGLGLFLGKQLGILLSVLLLMKLGVTTMQLTSRNVRYFHGLSLLAGIGFTMSLFVGGLAFGAGPIFEEAKLAILIASILSGVAGYLLLKGIPKGEEP